MRKTEFTAGNKVVVTKPSKDWYSATMEPYVSKELTLERLGSGPWSGETYAFCKETGEVPFNLNWLNPIDHVYDKPIGDPWPGADHTYFLKPGEYSALFGKRRMLQYFPKKQAANHAMSKKHEVLFDIDFSEIEIRIMEHMNKEKTGLKGNDKPAFSTNYSGFLLDDHPDNADYFKNSKGLKELVNNMPKVLTAYEQSQLIDPEPKSLSKYSQRDIKQTVQGHFLMKQIEEKAKEDTCDCQNLFLRGHTCGREKLKKT